MVHSFFTSNNQKHHPQRSVGPNRGHRWQAGIPVAFDGRETSWMSVKFQFVAHCGAIDSRLKDLPVLGESRGVAAMRDIHPDVRAPSARLRNKENMVHQEGTQKLLEHAGDTEGGVAWRRLDEYSFITNSPATREQRWTSSRCCCVGAARCQERTPVKASKSHTGGRGGAQSVDHAASSWPGTHADGHRRSRCEGQEHGQGQGQGQDRRRGDVLPLQQDGPSRG